MDRILQINAGSIENNNKDFNFGGVEVFLINLYRNIDKEKYIFDFLTPGKSTFSHHLEELKSFGSYIYELNVCRNRFVRLIQFFIRLVLFLRNHKYEIVHIHTGSLYLQTVSVLACKFVKVPFIISHSHGAKKYSSFLAKICQKIVTELSDYQLSCSKYACYSIFDSCSSKFNKIKIINNGIDIKKYEFSEKSRIEYRKKLGLEDKFVFGHIGNFVEAKNHLFLIDIFNEIKKINRNSVLLLIGDGLLKEKIEKKTRKLGLYNSTSFLGHRDDIPELLSCMDVFVFPSTHEGFGMTVIEAQASGLNCFISDSLSKEVDVTDLVYRISLNSSSQSWANNIINNISRRNRKNYNKLLLNKGFDLKDLVIKIQNLYEGILKEKNSL